MQPQDQFARAFGEMTARLAARIETWRDVADVEIEGSSDYWRVAMTPKAAGACSLEVVVTPSAQTFDLQIGPDTFEHLPLTRIDDIEDIVRAVAEGRASRRTGLSAAGGLLLWAETVLRRGADLWWRQRRVTPAGAGLQRANVVEREQVWLPYRRP
jgi:hypothetical protein